jgi:hypothetical protein
VYTGPYSYDNLGATEKCNQFVTIFDSGSRVYEWCKEKLSQE